MTSRNEQVILQDTFECDRQLSDAPTTEVKVTVMFNYAPRQKM
jgi:hypothetical protein